MANSMDRQRIISLQKALSLARKELRRLGSNDVRTEAVLDEIEDLDWSTKPTGLQGICGHGENVQ